MQHLGAELIRIEPGFCEIHIPYDKTLTQQHGFFHAGVVGTVADNAAGYASFSLMDETSSILTVEFKLNLISPSRWRKTDWSCQRAEKWADPDHLPRRNLCFEKRRRKIVCCGPVDIDSIKGYCRFGELAFSF